MQILNLEQKKWSEVRCFNIPVNSEMLTPNGFVRKLSCVLKNECPRKAAPKVRLVTFDRDYVILQLKKIKNNLNLSTEELSELLQ